jgi:hypothetical protein
MPPRALLVVLALPLLSVFTGCGRVSKGDHQAAIDCVRANLAAMQKGDMAAVAETLHPKSPGFLNTPEVMKSIMAQYKLSYELEECAVERATSAGIHVRFVQVTKRIAGPEDFPDSRMEGVHILKRDRRAWKIWFTQVRTTESLDGTPLPARPMVPEVVRAAAPVRTKSAPPSGSAPLN